MNEQKLIDLGDRPDLFGRPDSEFNDRLNRCYDYKLQAVTESKRDGRFYRYIDLHDRPYRLRAFVEICGQLSSAEYWELCSYVWCDTENMWQCLGLWKDVLSRPVPDRHLFTSEDDREFWNLQPERITVYRSHIGVNRWSLSWSLSRETEKV